MMAASPATILQLAFGGVAGITLVALMLFALDMAASKGWPRAIVSSLVTILALALLVAAASQLQLVLGQEKLDPKIPAPATLIWALRAFILPAAFWGAALAGAAVGLFLSITRDDSSEPEPELATAAAAE
jgi:hypothetical protein